MGGLLGQVLPLAIGAMISPTLLTLQVLVLSSPRSPKAKAWLLTLGAAATLAVFSILAGTLLANASGSSHASHGWLDITVRLVCGVALALLGVRALRRHPTPGERHQSRVQQRIAGAGPAWYLPVGVVGMLTDVSSLVLFIPAMHAIVRSDADDTSKAVAFIVLFCFVLIPVLVPVLLVTVLGHHADGMLAALNRFVTSNARFINAGICFVFAAFLLWTGVSDWLHL